MDKRTLSSIIMEQLDQMKIEYTHGNATDISIAKQFINAGCTTEDDKINYEAYILMDETSQTVNMYEDAKQIGKGSSFGAGSEAPFKAETTSNRKVNYVEYGKDGNTYEYEIDLSMITNSVMALAEQNGWDFKLVINKSEALYPDGYLPPFTPPVYRPPVEKVHEERQDEDSITGFCISCGWPIYAGAKFCKKCGAPVQVITLKTTNNIKPTATANPLYKEQPPQPQSQQQLQSQQIQQKNQHQNDRQYGNPLNSSDQQEPAQKNSKGGILGLVGVILLGLIMVLFLLVDESTIGAWGANAIVFAIALFIQRRIAKKGFVINAIVVIVAAVLLLITFVFTSTQISLTTAKIKSGYMTTAINSAGKPVNEVSTYKPNAAKLVAVGELQNAPPSTHVKFVWTYVTRKTHLADYVIDNGEQGANIYLFSYVANKKAWPKGNYKVEMYIEDRATPDATIHFTIK